MKKTLEVAELYMKPELEIIEISNADGKSGVPCNVRGARMKLVKAKKLAIFLGGAVVAGLAFAAIFSGSAFADEIILTTGKKGTGTIVSETASKTLAASS